VSALTKAVTIALLGPDDPTDAAVPWGRCSHCRRAYNLTANGLIRMHRYGRLNATCLGSGKPPLAVMS